MEELRKLLAKLNSGERLLTEREADLLASLLKSTIIEKGQNFEKRGSIRESLSLASDSCSHCGRPYF